MSAAEGFSARGQYHAQARKTVALVDAGGVPIPLAPSSPLLAKARVEAELLEPIGPGRSRVTRRARFTNATMARRWAEHHAAGAPVHLTSYRAATGWRPTMEARADSAGRWERRTELGAWTPWSI